MKVFVIGQGGREHAIAWKLIQSKKVEKVFVCPGNGGTAKEKNIENIDLSITDIPALINFANSENIDLTIVGPEAPLVEGIVDEFNKHNLRIFGPSEKYALLEGSKVFSKEFMKHYDIPTADYQMFSSASEAKMFIEQLNKQTKIEFENDIFIYFVEALQNKSGFKLDRAALNSIHQQF